MTELTIWTPEFLKKTLQEMTFGQEDFAESPYYADCEIAPFKISSAEFQYFFDVQGIKFGGFLTFSTFILIILF